MNDFLNTPSSKIDSGSDSARASAISGRLSNSVCAFWLGQRAFAIDTSLLGGVVSVGNVTPVPGSAEPVLGLFNLRGTPVALVDLAAIIDEPRLSPVGGSSTKTALIIRPGSTVYAGLLIDRMELVVRLDHGHFTAGDPSEDSPLVQGFFEIQSRGGMILTVLDAAALLKRLDRLKFR